MDFEIEIDSYTFYVRVVDYYAGYPAKTWGPWEDCYEECPEEIDWECTAIQACDEDGNVVVLTAEQVKNIISEYSEYIEDKLLEQIRELKEDDFDYPEPDYYDY